MTGRQPLTPGRIVAAAAAVADRAGLAGVSMRSVGKELGVEAMSLYHHVAGKDALVDALADWVFGQISAPRPGEPWREAMQTRAASTRAVLGRHPWGLGMIESRANPGAAVLHHHDAVLGTLLSAGFPMRLAAHAYSVLDAYVYGFVLTEVNLPFEATGGAAESFVADLAPSAEDYPHLTRMMAEMVVGGDYEYGNEFDDGLTMILDGLERRLAVAQGRAPEPGGDVVSSSRVDG